MEVLLGLVISIVLFYIIYLSLWVDFAHKEERTPFIKKSIIAIIIGFIFSVVLVVLVKPISIAQLEQSEPVETVKPIGTVYKFHKANHEGDEDKYLYVVAYEFEKIEDAVEFKRGEE